MQWRADMVLLLSLLGRCRMGLGPGTGGVGCRPIKTAVGDLRPGNLVEMHGQGRVRVSMCLPLFFSLNTC